MKPRPWRDSGNEVGRRLPPRGTPGVSTRPQAGMSGAGAGGVLISRPPCTRCWNMPARSPISMVRSTGMFDRRWCRAIRIASTFAQSKQLVVFAVFHTAARPGSVASSRLTDRNCRSPSRRPRGSGARGMDTLRTHPPEFHFSMASLTRASHFLRSRQSMSSAVITSQTCRACPFLSLLYVNDLP